MWVRLAFASVVIGGTFALGRQNSQRRDADSDSVSVQRVVENGPGAPPYSARSKDTLTFCKDIAPIVWNRCAPCHRPDHVAPFSLLSYSDIKKRVAQISEITARRIMPPWPPAPQANKFQDERRLTEAELGLLQQWIAEGSAEGTASNLPAPPQWPEGWFLGQPDLVVTMPRPYTIPAEGRDVYRNFVLAIPTTERRYVRAVELRPGNTRVVHHCFMFIDETGQSRRLDGKEAQLGAPYGTKMPEGQFLTYQPGRLPAMAPEGLAWTLERGSYIVLQMHLKPSGKAEMLQATVGFYFPDRAPTNTPIKVALTAYTIDIRAGEPNYMVRDSFVLPVDAEVTALLPHAHYLAREVSGFVSLPDGTTIPLIEIKNWDFDWQGAYRYAKPVTLPKGSTLMMQFIYDNSTNNVRNPNNPPKAVTFGTESTDEMAELWLQLLVRDPRDRALLARDYAVKNDRVYYERSQYLLRKNPNDPKGHFTLALILLNQKKTAAALRHFQLALAADPDYQEAYFTLGVVHLMNGNLHGAEEAFRNAIRVDPDDYRAHGMCSSKRTVSKRHPQNSKSRFALIQMT